MSWLMQELEDMAGMLILFIVEAWPIWIVCVLGATLLVCVIR